MPPAIILASTSPTRKMLLANAGITFTVVPPTYDENILKQQQSHYLPENLAVTLASNKALSISPKYPDHLIIGADQVLVQGTKIYSKPKNAAEARLHLLELAGSSHVLHSAACCIQNGAVLATFCTHATMTMRTFSSTFLDHYIAHSGTAVLSSVGAYQIESTGIQLFDHIEGDYPTILGLPLLPLLGFLRQHGALLT